MSGRLVLGLDLFYKIGLTSPHLKGILSFFSRVIRMPQGVFKRPSARERFFKKVIKTPTCWLWTGYLLKDGYGSFSEFRKSIPAHRYSYKEFVAPIPVGLLVRHSCDNPSCVNPEHLVLGTQKDNCQDAVSRGRNVHGESHGGCKITASIAKQVKVLLSLGRSMVAISQELHISYYVVCDIKRGKTWNSV